MNTVKVSINRKHSVADFETVDVYVEITAECQPKETQSEATQRVFAQLYKDFKKISLKTRASAKKCLI